MQSNEMATAVQTLGMSLTDIAEDINRLAGTKMSVADLSRMKGGGRDPSPVVAVYLGLKLEQRRREAMLPLIEFEKALETAGLRLVRTGAPPDLRGTPRKQPVKE